MAKRGWWTGVLAAGLLAVVACGGSSSGSGPSPDGGAATGGSGGTSGAGGTGGFINNMADKIDLLFMVDNSISMADKQEILAQAVPPLVTRLIAPAIDPGTGKPEFKPIVDIHVGVISSSLGSHGGDACSGQFSQTQNDHARLIATVRPEAGLTSHQNLGFLWWDPTGTAASPPGEPNEAAFISSFVSHVKAVGENGCGYEASLEAWYRFLVDPNPPEDVVVEGNVAKVTGVDQIVLQQRKDFLRPDSLVAIVMLSDENDCSTVDGGINWLAAQIASPGGYQAFHLPRATSACASDPNSPCCRSCASLESAPPAGCESIASDPGCAQGTHDDVSDHPNLRCWEQKRRFGLDFLYPTRRYVEGLTQPAICPVWDSTGPVACSDMSSRVPNPLFQSSAGGAVRGPGLVFFATIVGVPWQDIATEESLIGPSLEYLTASELAAKGRWDWLTPKCKQWVTDPLPRPMPTLCQTWDHNDYPDDALMVESSLPRTGTALGINQPLQPPDSAVMANPINGHEWNTADSDLQYACIFRLSTPKSCEPPTGPIGCDCDDVYGTGYTANNPLCQSGSGYSTTQQYAKAFPGTRHLEVARDFGENAIVASICPKIYEGSTSDPGYGYNPVVNAIIERLKEQLPPGS